MAKTIKHPAAAEPWRGRLRQFSLQVGFRVQLSKAMLEFLCAVADGVQWDRYMFCDITCPDNWLASENSLIKRGLVERIPAEELEARMYDKHERGEFACCRLTPAGQLVVDLVKMAGVFVEADAAINKKSRKEKRA